MMVLFITLLYKMFKSKSCGESDADIQSVYFRQASGRIQEGLILSQLPSPVEGLVEGGII